ncbi:hypothetical protein C7B62_22400 [Pleurocapsa sp. CCALA 161]|uniref:hypothetical protein n=1 Tax=Pleurocapsa sp. CCALA 161 TaxID=2107688 RepID=UPI000D0595C6|nr:hypothetical protein [Pleurocapsa sp. CCALA 161]PSB06593.1 hypothetical protein C7B62_22400 [Pleurocapsa sp. CCALA 161]
MLDKLKTALAPRWTEYVANVKRRSVESDAYLKEALEQYRRDKYNHEEFSSLMRRAKSCESIGNVHRAEELKEQANKFRPSK